MTEIFPVVAPAGTEVAMWLASGTENVAVVPLNFTLVAPVKFVPVTVTLFPAAPLVGEKLVIVGAGSVTEKLAAELAVPPGVTTEIFPLVAPAGTVAVICVAFTTENDVATVPLNDTDVAPVNPVPVTVTLVPAVPLVGEKLVIAGAVTVTEKLLAELAVPFGVTTEIFPDVAPVGTVAVTCVALTAWNVVAAVPLKATELAPVKLVPATVTLVPTAPLAGEKLAIVGVLLGAGPGEGLPDVPPAQPARTAPRPQTATAIRSAPLFRASAAAGKAPACPRFCVPICVAPIPFKHPQLGKGKTDLAGVPASGNRGPTFSWKLRILGGKRADTCPNGQFWVSSYVDGEMSLAGMASKNYTEVY